MSGFAIKICPLKCSNNGANLNTKLDPFMEILTVKSSSIYYDNTGLIQIQANEFGKKICLDDLC